MDTRKLSLQLIFSLIIVFNTYATNYYVSNNGTNSNTGLDATNAFLTIQQAADIVVAGDTVYVENGIYAGFDLRNTHGTSENPIVFKATGNDVIINQNGPKRADGINIEGVDYVIIDGFKANNMKGNGNGIRVVLSDHCIIRNCSCDSNAERGIFTGFTDDILIENNICTNSIDEHGIYVSNSSDRPIIRNNECYGNNGAGIHMNGDLSIGGDGIISDAQVYGNIIYDNNKAAGINMDGLQDPIIYNNLIYNNHSSQGIALFKGDGAIVTNGAKIYNNTIIVPTDGRWGILVKDGANVATEIYNNIIINQHAWRGCIAIENASQFSSNYNILNDKMSANGDGSTIKLEQWQALEFDNNSMISNTLQSLFIDSTNNNYQLNSDSQAIDTGTNIVNPIVSVDLIGTSKNSGEGYDIGAYESTPTLSINKYDLSDSIKLFPNPTSNYITITNEKHNFDIKSVTLLDINGRFIKKFTSNYFLDVQNINNGTYFISIVLNNDKNFIKKIIVN